MQRVCTQCSAAFEIEQRDLDLLERLSPVIGGKTFVIPPSSLCFDCRLQRRLAFYNCRTLYRRKSDATRKEIVSIFSQRSLLTDVSINVYNVDMQSDSLHVRIPRKLKRAAQKIIEANGLDVSSAIRLFFTHITVKKTIPLTFLTENGLPRNFEEHLLALANSNDFIGPFDDAESAIRALNENPD